MMGEGQFDEEEKRKHKKCKKNEKGGKQKNYRKLYSLMPT
jgi:hypothetical protein